ncbi:MAG TPA: type IV secretory system conjugative DNA transfer family protein [Solirubrobacterales bacterium]|nr:type IV secretory system conjugative DNA transfer family protein [Solirubrobacterales bacterium]
MSLPGDIGGGTLLVALALAAVLVLFQLLDGHLREGGSASRRVQGARWAKRRDLRDLELGKERRGRLVLGRLGGRLLATVGQASVVVVGPSRISFKTTGFTIPAVLEWEGPVVVTSVKTDLLRATIGARRDRGEVMVFDPTGESTFGSVKATPLSGCGDWRGAMQVAHRLSAAARTGTDGLDNSEFWHAAAEKLLSPLLFAAASSEGEMGDVIDWLNDGPAAEPEVRERLEAAGCQEALGAWRANWHREDRSRSSIYTTAETVLRAFEDPRVLEATSRADYTPARLLDGAANTLYLCAPAHEQERLRSLFAAMLSELVAEVQELSSRKCEPIDPPLLFVLDEAANTAPVPDLDVVAATGAGQGIQLVSVFQDFAQVEARWGKRAQTILNNHQAKVFPTGISDPETLRYISAVVGEGEFRQRSETAAERGRGSSTEGSTYRALTPANVVREADPGTGVLIYGHRPPARIELRPYFKDPQLSEIADRGDR